MPVGEQQVPGREGAQEGAQAWPASLVGKLLQTSSICVQVPSTCAHMRVLVSVNIKCLSKLAFTLLSETGSLKTWGSLIQLG